MRGRSWMGRREEGETVIPNEVRDLLRME